MNRYNNNIIELREKENIKLEHLAKLMKISKSYLSQLELNHRRISLDDYCLALDILGYEMVVRRKGGEERNMDNLEQEKLDMTNELISDNKITDQIHCKNLQ